MSQSINSARAQFVKWSREVRALGERLEDSHLEGADVRDVPWPPFPGGARGLTCGAKTRAGTPCRRRDLNGNGRCKLHGGLSTGPQTEEGRKRAIANLKVRWRQGTP